MAQGVRSAAGSRAWWLGALTAALWLAGCLGLAAPTPAEVAAQGEGSGPGAAVQSGGGEVSFDSGLVEGGLVDGGSSDAGTDAGAHAGADAGVVVPPVEDAGPGSVPTFVAQGHLARTIVSCDLGKSWVADRDDVEPLDRCWTTPPAGGVEYECDHQPTAGRGIAYGEGTWVANFGWGPVGTVRHSKDGVTWESVDAGRNFASMVYAGGGFFAADGSPRQSRDLGRTWEAAGVVPDVWTTLSNVRRGGGGQLGGGTVYVLAGDNGIAVGRPSGQDIAWTLPAVSSTCRAPMTQGGVVVALGRILLVSGDGVACSSTDGVTFETVSVGGPVTSHLVFDGQQFLAWGPSSVFRSTDAIHWTTTPIKLASGNGTPDIGPAAFGAGVYVAVTGQWRAWYEEQGFYRSTDGVTWEALPASAFTGGHPIINIAFGAAPPCPRR